MSDWKYDLEDVGPDGVVERSGEPPIEPGSPSLENVAFVVLGAAVALYVFAKLLGVG
ncbi:MAG: hypothetical protein ABEJ76_01915 [Halanaeroarchaeum sp.]